MRYRINSIAEYEYICNKIDYVTDFDKDIRKYIKSQGIVYIFDDEAEYCSHETLINDECDVIQKCKFCLKIEKTDVKHVIRQEKLERILK